MGHFGVMDPWSLKEVRPNFRNPSKFIPAHSDAKMWWSRICFLKVHTWLINIKSYLERLLIRAVLTKNK